MLADKDAVVCVGALVGGDKKLRTDRPVTWRPCDYLRSYCGCVVIFVVAANDDDELLVRASAVLKANMELETCRE